MQARALQTIFTDAAELSKLKTKIETDLKITVDFKELSENKVNHDNLLIVEDDSSIDVTAYVDADKNILDISTQPTKLANKENEEGSKSDKSSKEDSNSSEEKETPQSGYKHLLAIAKNNEETGSPPLKKQKIDPTITNETQTGDDTSTT